MPTVLRRDGFKVRVLGPPREHPPPHVHVEFGAEGLVVIRLGIDGGAPKVWEVYKMRNDDVVRAFRLVEENHERLLAAWEKIRG
jgi:hypothetical protein